MRQGLCYHMLGVRPWGEVRWWQEQGEGGNRLGSGRDAGLSWVGFR